MSSTGDQKVKTATLAVAKTIESSVFESAVVIMGVPEEHARSILSRVLNTVSVSEKDLHIQVLGLVMPQVERGLRTYLSHSETSEVMSGLENLVLGWDAAVKAKVPTPRHRY
ncbi:MAG: hypothetical protein JKY56_11325 [Kofleriaceae bacterium]|nr:hypothetical protein [Kofleriaceae bacterium]